MNKIARIRAEIESDLALNENYFANSDADNEAYCYARILLCKSLLKFIESLQGPSLPPYVNDAAQDYVESKKNDWLSTDAWDFVFEAFVAGAEWQKEQKIKEEQI